MSRIGSSKETVSEVLV